MCLVPGTGTITAAFTATAPTFSDSKQGFYLTGAQANYRVIGGCHDKTSTAYEGKFLVKGSGSTLVKDFFVKTYVSARLGVINGGVNVTDTAWYDLNTYNQNLIDTESEFNATTGEFSPTISGFYKINYRIGYEVTTGVNTYTLALYDGSSNVLTGRVSDFASSSVVSDTIEGVLELDSSKTYKFRVSCSASSKSYSTELTALTIEKLPY